MEEKLSHYRIHDMQSKIALPPYDIMLAGVTGAGKSSTINALLGSDAAKIGWGANPETKTVTNFALNDYIRFWDTPGLGDSPEEDAAHLQKISSYLSRANMKNGVQCGKMIDAVLVIIDGSRRDLGAIYQLLNGTIFKGIDSGNVLFAVNQADMAMSGRHWKVGEDSPDETLISFLHEQAKSIQQRISENTGCSVLLPLCYSAASGFNTERLIDYILDNLPPQRKTAAQYVQSSRSNAITYSHYDDDDDDDDDLLSDILLAPLNAANSFMDWLNGLF